MNRRLSTRLEKILLAVGLLALGYWGAEFVSARLYQLNEARQFGSSAPSVSREESHATPQPYPASGSSIAILTIPRLGLSAVVVEGAEERELKLGPGHIRRTSLPGAGGNVGVAGHRDTFFRPLRLIRKDDLINLTTHDREYVYRVVSTEIVEPDDVQVLRAKGHETLTLVTCYPFDFVGSAPKRFIVHADCVACPDR